MSAEPASGSISADPASGSLSRLVLRLALRLAHAPLRPRRLVVWSLWQARRFGRRPDPFGIASAIAHVLDLPLAAARRIGDRYAFADLLHRMEWLALEHRSIDGLKRDARAVRFDNLAALAAVAAGDRPLLLMPLHTGAGGLALAALIHFHLPGRRVLVLRSDAEGEEVRALLARFAGQGHEIRDLSINDKVGFVEALRWARRRSVIVTFADLPPSYGTPAEIGLFRDRLHLAVGHDGLARALDADVVPVRLRSGLGGDRLTIGTPFHIAESGAEGRRRMVVAIARHLRQALLAAPDQWHMWPRIADYVQAGSDA